MKTHGVGHLKNLQAKPELTSVNRELKRLKTQAAALEGRRAQLLAIFVPTGGLPYAEALRLKFLGS